MNTGLPLESKLYRSSLKEVHACELHVHGFYVHHFFLPGAEPRIEMIILDPSSTIGEAIR